MDAVNQDDTSIKTTEKEPEIDLNGEKINESNDATIHMDVVESEQSEINENDGMDVNTDNTNDNSTDDGIGTNSTVDDTEIKTESKSRKRKLSEPSKDDKVETDENKNKDKENEQTENVKKTEDETALSPDLNISTDDVFGKGKRARIPNKRYSDIALSSTKPIIKPSYLVENGEDTQPILSPSLDLPHIKEETGKMSPVPKRQKVTQFNISNPNFLKPFKFGWKRELVWRSIHDGSGKRNSDIYYYSPQGKKFRSMREISDALRSKDLSIDDFTFYKEALGVNDPEKEIVRDAKVKTAGTPVSAKKSTPKPKKSFNKSKSIGSPKSEHSDSNQELINNKSDTSTSGLTNQKVTSPKLELPTTPSQKGEKGAASKTESTNKKKVNLKNDSGNQGDKTETTPNVRKTRRKITESPSNTPAKISSPKVNFNKTESSDESKNSSKTTKNNSKTKAPGSANNSETEEKPQKSSPLRVKITSKAKGDKKLTNKQANSEEDTVMPAKKAPQRKSIRGASKQLNDIPTSPKKKSIKLSNQSNEKTNEGRPMENYLQNLSYGYSTLLYVFQYLKVQDLLRAGCVCTMWRDIANHPLLWRTVRMKNSQVHSFEGLAEALEKHGTVTLDLRKMLLTTCVEIWPEFSNNIGKVDTLRKIELCKCPSSVVESLMESNPKLEVVNAVTIRCETMSFDGLSNWKNLRELRLKSLTGLKLTSDIESLKELKNLQILSLTSIKDLKTMNLNVIAELENLECLDLGECTDFPENFGQDILLKLTKLEKLRLEKGQGSCHIFEILEAVKMMENLEQLELVNFDIKSGFDKALGACKNIKKLLIIPTYISQSATTNHMVLGGVLRLQKSLSHFVWGVTLELLRVTELFVDQCEEPEKKDKKEKKQMGTGDSIPVLKPVPLLSDENDEIPPALDPPQVEILALPGLQKLLLQSLPTTRVKILKIPFHATWRQSINDAVN